MDRKSSELSPVKEERTNIILMIHFISFKGKGLCYMLNVICIKTYIKLFWIENNVISTE
jgi:hypothetical protein